MNERHERPESIPADQGNTPDAGNSCCSSEKQESCCEPSAKAACCGTSEQPRDNGCGCQ